VKILQHPLKKTGRMGHNEFFAKVGHASEDGICQSILENTVDSVLIISHEGHIMFFNRSAQQLLGYLPSEVMGRDISMLILNFKRPDEEVLKRYLRLLERGPAGPGREAIAIHKNSNRIPAFMTFSHIRIQGEIFYVIFIRDYSKLRAYESELKKLSLVASKTVNGVVMTGKDKKIEWVNEGFTRLTGYSFKEAVGKHPGKLLQGPGTDARITKRIRENLRLPYSFTETVLNYKKDGTPYWSFLYITPIIGEDGQTERFFAIQTDITDVVSAQRALEETNSYLKKFSQNLIALNKVFTKSFNSFDLLLTNILHTGLDVFGFSQGILSRLEGNQYRIEGFVSDNSILNMDMVLRLQDTFCDSVVNERKTVSYSCISSMPELNSRLFHRHLKQESYIGTPVFVYGELYGTLNFSSAKAKQEDHFDISKDFIEIMAQMLGKAIESNEAQKQKEQVMLNLETAKKSAEESDKAKEIFLANTSHELRTPMNVIIGMLEVLKRTQLSKKQAEYVSIIENTSENLLYILNDILDISKIKSGKLDFEVTGFHLNAIIKSIIETGTSLASKKNISFKFICGAECGDVILLGDPVRLSQVLFNLTSNAIKFTERGQVLLEMFLLEMNDSFMTIRFEVSDTGIGISEDQLERIFLDFTQADTSTTRVYGGTGLGLPISRNLVELMGGKLRVESQAGKGSKFYFTLNFNIGTPEDLPEIVRKRISRGMERGIRNLRILLAEDNPFNVMIIKEIFTSSNCIVETAANGEEAIRLLTDHDFDVVLMDIQMPVMDGVEACQYIRNNLPKPKSSIPIVALTAHAKKGDKEKYMQFGMNAYVSKPYKPYELKMVLVEVLNIHDHPDDIPEQAGVKNADPEAARLYDLQQLIELSDGDEDFIRASITTFLVKTREAISDFQRLLPQGEYREIAKTAHRISTGFATLGMEGFFKLLSEIEEAGNENSDQVREKVMQFLETAEPVLNCLEEDISARENR